MSFLKVFQLQERGMWLCKKKHIEKMDKCPRYLKTMGTQMATMKKEKKKKRKK
jgi:hypothetical protein